MKSLLPLSIVSFLLSWLDLAGAARLQVHGRSPLWEKNALEIAERRGLVVEKRSNIHVDQGSGILTNSDDIVYYSSLTLGGKNFTVLIDTGSTDLWVGGNVPGAKPSGKSTSIQYAVGSASGPIQYADLNFLGFNVSDQAFISATGKTDGTGLIGLGPNRGSNIRETLKSSKGNAVLDRIFLSDPSTPNYLTTLLGRSDDPTDLYPGDITIGELVPGFENVTGMPKIPVAEVSLREKNDQHWQIHLDEDGIIGPDGLPINVTSLVDGGKRLNAVLDTGFSLTQVPRQISDAIYGRIPGATFGTVGRGVGETWKFPCDVEVNLTFSIAGVKYPIHPLDTSLDWSENGTSFCIGSFQPRIIQNDNYDMILGMSFLRNTYMLINFGDFVDGKTDKVANPYVQLLPTTDDITEAHNDFVNLRLKGIDTTKEQTLLDTPNLSGPPDVGNSNSNISSWLDKHKTILIAVGASVGGVLLILIAALCFRRRTNVREKSGKKTRFLRGVPVSGNGGYRQVGGDYHGKV